MKLNVLLALTDTLRSKYKNMVADHTKFYANKQGQFAGVKNTFEAKEGCSDEPSKRKFIRVVTTVDEKLDYFKKESAEFVNANFSQEKTNASGIAQAELTVHGQSWGVFTSLELLRLKSLLESSDLGQLEPMLASIPVRSDAKVWNLTLNEDYEGRTIWETKQVGGESKTTDRIEYILADPNIATGKVTSNYIPKTSTRNEVKIIGDYTTQDFSGEWSHRQRAGALARRSDLLTAVVVALKMCNDCETVKSDLTAENIFGFIFNGVYKA